MVSRRERPVFGCCCDGGSPLGLQRPRNEWRVIGGSGRTTARGKVRECAQLFYYWSRVRALRLTTSLVNGGILDHGLPFSTLAVA